MLKNYHQELKSDRVQVAFRTIKIFFFNFLPNTKLCAFRRDTKYRASYINLDSHGHCELSHTQNNIAKSTTIKTTS